MSEHRKKIRVFEAADIPKMYRNIFEAYHNESDLLSELLQNAIDSIRIAEPDNPLVEIKFNKKDQLLSVKDNGIGMGVEDLEDFAIGRTKKSGPRFSSLGGEKGLGASYIFGGSDRFFIETCKEGKLTIAECLDAYDAITNSKEPEFFIIEEEIGERLPNSTEIQITGKLFYLDFKDRDEIESLIRTYTAVGFTLPLIGGEGLDIRTKLTWIDENGEESSKFVVNCFRHPVADYEDMILDYSDVENVDSGFGMFLSKIDVENQVIGIFGESSLFQKLDLPTGIVLSVKGYPTIVEIGVPRTGYAGYWARNILILINDDNVVLDPGRKTIRTEDKRRIKNVAKDIFNKLVKYHKRIIRQTELEAEKAISDNLKEEARELDQLNINKIAYRKKPIYEQGVVAIFHQLLGAKILDGYYTLSSSTDTRYDEICYYEIPINELGGNFKQKFLEARRNLKDKGSIYKNVITIEYKLNANDIMRDIKKDLRLIDLLIAWDCDTAKLKPQWKFSTLDPLDIVYKGAKYQLRNPMNDACHVMLLKDFDDSN